MLTQFKWNRLKLLPFELNQVAMATLNLVALASLIDVRSSAFFGFRFHDPAAGSEVVFSFLINCNVGFRICDHGDNSIVLATWFLCMLLLIVINLAEGFKSEQFFFLFGSLNFRFWAN